MNWLNRIIEPVHGRNCVRVSFMHRSARAGEKLFSNVYGISFCPVEQRIEENVFQDQLYMGTNRK